MSYRVNYSKGQLKIQQMAFVLVALIIFFAMVSLFYFSIRVSNIQKSAVSLSEDAAKELVRKLSGTPEFAWTATDCASCIDLDKVILLKNRKAYSGFWSLDYLAVERVYPSKEGECTKGNYPNCNKITIINKTLSYGSPAWAYVALCRQDFAKSAYVKCELGRIFAAGKGIQ